MRTHQISFVSALLSTILLLTTICQRQLKATTSDTISGFPAKATQASRPSALSTDSTPTVKRILQRISFEKTVCDLGDVGQGTKNECEFRFTNTGRGLLKIGNISRTCGCTVFQLDKKQYAPNQTGIHIY